MGQIGNSGTNSPPPSCSPTSAAAVNNSMAGQLPPGSTAPQQLNIANLQQLQQLSLTAPQLALQFGATGQLGGQLTAGQLAGGQLGSIAGIPGVNTMSGIPLMLREG